MRRMLRVIEDLQTYISNAKKKHHFELGELYINDNNIVYVIDDAYSEFFYNAKEYIEGLNYLDVQMKCEVSRYLPKIIKTLEVEDKLVMVLDKTSDLVLLRDAFDFLDHKMDPKAVAWILSSMYNIACYFEMATANISHNDISLDTYFISPEFHSGVLLGGWWYANKIGEKMSAVPSRTFNFLPLSVKETKHSNRYINLDLIKATGRELLGDLKGDKLSSMNSVPEALINWLRTCSSDSAIRDYRIWKDDVIKASFGGRFFTPMNIKPSDIYK